jgi:hypothetical protein
MVGLRAREVDVNFLFALYKVLQGLILNSLMLTPELLFNRLHIISEYTQSNLYSIFGVERIFKNIVIINADQSSSFRSVSTSIISKAPLSFA